jgi:hypothetical protein
MRSKRFPTLVIALGAVISLTLFLLWFHGIPSKLRVDSTTNLAPANPPSEEPEQPHRPKYKDKSDVKPIPPISDNFPLAAGLTKGQLPNLPSWNKPPTNHVLEKTPLFIGFTRNWPLLQQSVLSYITAGWPPEDIYVVDNTGTMRSNFPPNPKLTLQNPFFINVPRLTDVFQVNVIATPTLLTFAQLQNFYLYTAMEMGWDYFFWSHMDVIALTEEKYEGQPFRSLYLRAVDKLREATSPDYLREPDGTKPDWAIHFFAYDWLALNNVESFMKVGGWDTFISYYKTDCDMHSRFEMHGTKMPSVGIGRVSDVGSSIDLSLLFRRKVDPQNPPKTFEELDNLPQDDRGGEGFETLTDIVGKAAERKISGEDGSRNSWQVTQTGGQGEPFYRDPQGFEFALQQAIECGKVAYDEKWGHRDCGLTGAGLNWTDAWQVEHDWE